MTLAQREHPEAAAEFDAAVRWYTAIRGYPYRIVYTVEPDAILILAYAHERREPGYWLHRRGN